MIEYNLDATHSVLNMRFTSALTVDDLVNIAKVVDQHIEATGGLAGLIIEIPEFPGWESFEAMITHFRLVRDHHKYIKKAAVVTDSTLVKVIESIGSHFVSAEVKQFPGGQTEAAKQWILGGS